MKKLVIAFALSSLLAAGLATAQSHTLKIRIDDSAMNYAPVEKDTYTDLATNYAVKDTYRANMSAATVRDTAHLKLGYQDHTLTVFLASQPQPDGLLTLSISDIPRYMSIGMNLPRWISHSTDGETTRYVSFVNPEAADMQNARGSRYTSNRVTSIKDIKEISFVRYATTANHFKIVHHNFALKALMETYDNALSALGFSRVEETNQRNGGIYLYQNGTDRLKLTFHRENNGVTMWMQSL